MLMDAGKVLHIFLWILTVYTLSLKSASSSHYEGGSVSWRPGTIYTDEDITEILIDFRIAWRRSNSGSTFCDQTDVDSGKILRHNDSYVWECIDGCSGSVSFDGVICSEFDEKDDWTVGSRTVAFNITGVDYFAMTFTGCCWISSLVYVTAEQVEWNMTFGGSVGIRSDTGNPNRPPIATATPVIRFQAGCPGSVDLPLYDEDHDTVKCKLDVCEKVSCNDHPYLKLTQQGQKCRLSYNAGGPGNIDVAISIIIEDFPSKNNLLINNTLVSSTTAISSSSLQFIVRLFNDDHACKLIPTWVNPTFPNGFIKTAIVNESTNIALNISSETPLETLHVIAPIGVKKSTILSTGTYHSSTLTFTPTSEHIGSNVICTTAKDTNGKMSEHRCMNLIVGEGSLCDIDNGGCSDDCEVTGVSYICVCTRDCWQLADDRRTCIPKITIKCHSDKFEVALPVCAVGATAVRAGFYNQLNGVNADAVQCEADVVGDEYMKIIQYDECLTQKEEDFTELHFKNQLRMWIDDEDTFPGSGEEKITITRGFWYNIKLVCSFSKYSNVNASFRPIDQEEGKVLVPGLGSFQFFFDFYLDEHFKATYSPYSYPITVTVNSDIYFGIRTIGGTGLEVFTEKCVAMTTAVPTANTVSYTMMENGCLEDGTMVKYETVNAMEDRYSIKAFRFQDNLNTDSSVNIYIQCSAVLCIVGEETTRCSKGCVRSRKRRGENDEIFVEHSIDSRVKRDAEDERPPTVPTNISESDTFDIQVSGPFRIEVVQTEGKPPVTVATPTRHLQDGVKTTPKPAGPSKPEIRNTPSESFIVIIVASSVGGIVVIVLLCLLVILVLYYYIALKPRHKVLPDKESTVTARTLSAWTIEGDEEEYPRPYFNGRGKTPPPSFWEVERMNT
ncbi:uncharacterized protein LOC120328192 [Styela clava]